MILIDTLAVGDVGSWHGIGDLYDRTADEGIDRLGLAAKRLSDGLRRIRALLAASQAAETRFNHADTA